MDAAVSREPTGRADAQTERSKDRSDERIAHILRDASNAFQRSLQVRLAEHGIAIGQWSILRALWDEEGLSQHDLSERAGVMDPTGLVTIRAMERDGLVVRARKLGDRKRVFVFLTTRGRELRDILVPIAESTNELARAGLTDEEVDVTRRALLRMTSNLSKGTA